jgi:catalase (peroxidase I)
MEAMGLRWHNPKGRGFAHYTMTNGIEGSWTPNPTQWDNSYLENLVKFDWKQTKSPAAALEWKPSDPSATPSDHRPSWTLLNLSLRSVTSVFLRSDEYIPSVEPGRIPLSPPFLAQPSGAE